MRTRRVAAIEAFAFWIELEAFGERAIPMADVGRTERVDAIRGIDSVSEWSGS